MALQPTLNPYLRSFSVVKKNARTYAAAAAAAASKPKTDASYTLPREPLKTTTLDNVTVSSVETNRATARLAVYFKAGSRHESYETQGLAHALRIFSGLGTAGASQFGLSRTIDQHGGKLSCESGREHICYTLEATRNNIPLLDKFLQNATVNQKFKPWELSDHLERLKLDRILRPPEVRTLELLHKAAFRTGLGNSLYSPKHMVGKHNSEMLLDFVAKNFVEAAVVGVGLPHEQVVDFAGRLNIKPGSRTVEPQKYHGGAEIRKESGGDIAYVALAIEGAPFTKQKEQIAAALVHRALGSGPRTKFGFGSGKLNAATKDTKKESVASGFSTSYSDSGLIGVFIYASCCCAGDVTKKAAELLRTGSFNDQDLSRAKAVLKSDIVLALESDEGLVDDLGLQSLHHKKVTSFEEVSGIIDSITTADLNKAVTGGKLSMASYGNIGQVPYIDQLK